MTAVVIVAAAGHLAQEKKEHRANMLVSVALPMIYDGMSTLMRFSRKLHRDFISLDCLNVLASLLMICVIFT